MSKKEKSDIVGNTDSRSNFIYYKKLDNQKTFSRIVAEMFQKSIQMFKYKGFPKDNDTLPHKTNISDAFLEYLLQNSGYVVITYVKKDEIHPTTTFTLYDEGYYAFSSINGCNLVGPYTSELLPITCTITNASMGITLNRTINKDCVLILNDSLLTGLRPYHTLYGKLITDNYMTMNMIGKNRRYDMVFSAPTDPVKQSIDGFLNDLEDGKIASIKGEQLIQSMNAIPKGTTNTNLIEFIEQQQYFIGQWSKGIGIKDQFNMKRESLNETEVNSDNISLLPKIDNMKYEREQGLQRLKAIYGIEVTFDFGESWKIVHEEVDIVDKDVNDEQDVQGDSNEDNQS